MWPRRRDRDAAQEARRARQRAEWELTRDRARTEATKAETPLYRSLADSLRDLRKRNHFAEGIEAIFRGGN